MIGRRLYCKNHRHCSHEAGGHLLASAAPAETACCSAALATSASSLMPRCLPLSPLPPCS